MNQITRKNLRLVQGKLHLLHPREDFFVKSTLLFLEKEPIQADDCYNSFVHPISRNAEQTKILNSPNKINFKNYDLNSMSPM